MHHLDGDQRHGLTIDLISQEVVDSSAIEGEVLDRMRVQSSLAKHMGFAADSRKANAAEAGAAELMENLYRTYADPLTDQQLFDLHTILINGRRALTEIRPIRTHTHPQPP